MSLDVTKILLEARSDSSHASEKLLPLIYEELRRLARSKMRQQRADHTLGATALVHEAYLRIVHVSQLRNWESRGHFFSAAADAMRCILIDNARRRKRIKHGGEFRRVHPDALDNLTVSLADDDLVAFDEALAKLAVQDEPAAEVVKLRFYAGLSMPEIAEFLNRPLRTIEREWRYARCWLRREMTLEDASSN